MSKFLSACALLFALPTLAQDVVALLPDFPYHWDQTGLYNEGILEEYGTQYGDNPCAGCVAISGASILEWFGLPEAFGEGSGFVDKERPLRTERLDWNRLGPALRPLDARGRRTAQTALYNLGVLVGMGYRDFPAASTASPSSLAKALIHESVGYASAYFVNLEGASDEATFEAAVWASLRCGSPVGLNIQGASAHAVPALGCRIAADGAKETLVAIGMQQTEPFWRALPNIGYNGYDTVPSVITGIVPRRPEGIAAGHYAMPILGTVVDARGDPVPLAAVTLTKDDGTPLGRTATDLKGRFGIWGWLGYAMNLACDGAAPIRLPARPNSLVNTYTGGVPRMAIGDLRALVRDNTVTLTVAGEGAQPVIHADLASATAAAAGSRILCLNSESPDLKASFRRVEGLTLLYADPRLDAPFPEIDARPDATFFLLDADGNVLAYSLAKDEAGLRAFLAAPADPEPLTLAGEATLTEACNGRDVVVSGAATVTVSGDVRLGALRVLAPLTLAGEGTCAWATLDQRAALTLDGPNLRYVPPKVGDGSATAFPGDLTLRNGAELLFANGDVSGYGQSGGTLTVGPGSVLAVASRDTLRRPLVLAGGRLELGDKGGDFGSLDLFVATLSVTADSAVVPLSGANEPRLTVRNGANAIALSDGAALDVRVPVTAAENGSLLLTGQGTAAFHDAVSAPVTVGAGVRLEGGIFSGGLSLTGGASLTADAPITVTGAFSASGVIRVEGTRSGLIVRGNVNVGNATFDTEEGFEVRQSEEGLRLVATHATPEAIYVGGASAETLPDTPERNLLVLTTTERKEAGLWERYAIFRSSEEGGGWNVKIAATGNLAQGQTIADYVRAAGCRFVLIGASAAEAPALSPPTDRLVGFCVGRLPLRETLLMGTEVDPGKNGASDSATYSDAALLDAYVGKLTRAGARHAAGVVGFVGGDYGTGVRYTNTEPYEEIDGFPANDDSSWFIRNQTGQTLFALRDRYRALRLANPRAFPSVTAFVSTTAPGYSVSTIYATDGALLWAEDAPNRRVLGPFQIGTAKVGECVAEAIPALYSLVVSPAGHVGDFSAQTPDAPSMGEMLVLNPVGGALTVVAPTDEAPFTVAADGIPSGATHTACATIAGRLIAAPGLTVGEAFADGAADTALTLLGDPTVRLAPFPPPSADDLVLPDGEEETVLSEEAVAALLKAAEDAGLAPPYRVAVRSPDGKRLPVAALSDALACFEGLTPFVEEGQIVVAYDFRVTAIAMDADGVSVTVAARDAEGWTLPIRQDVATFALVPEDGRPAAAPIDVTANADGGVTLRFATDAQANPRLFRITVRR